MKTGKVILVGAGPGDPELITIKGLRAIEQADCILYDFLSPPELLKYAGKRHSEKTCEQICVGKADGLHLKNQDEINQLLLEKVKEHQIVVRLKGGDPFLFSRGIEEARFLEEHHILFEVIPGITAAFAAAETSGIPLTMKNKYSSVAVVTGRKHNPNAEIEAPDVSTIIYLMAVKNIKNVVKSLLNSGRSPDMACVFVEKVTRKDARIIYATISTVEDQVKKEKVTPPAVLIVGKVIDHELQQYKYK